MGLDVNVQTRVVLAHGLQTGLISSHLTLHCLLVRLRVLGDFPNLTCGKRPELPAERMSALLQLRQEQSSEEIVGWSECCSQQWKLEKLGITPATEHRRRGNIAEVSDCVRYRIVLHGKSSDGSHFINHVSVDRIRPLPPTPNVLVAYTICNQFLGTRRTNYLYSYHKIIWC